MAQMTPQEISDAVVKLATVLRFHHGMKNARKIAKRTYRELRRPTAEEMRGILLVMESEEMNMPFGW